jgi:hypothetical protein
MAGQYRFNNTEEEQKIRERKLNYITETVYRAKTGKTSKFPAHYRRMFNSRRNSELATRRQLTISSMLCYQLC